MNTKPGQIVIYSCARRSPFVMFFSLFLEHRRADEENQFSQRILFQQQPRLLFHLLQFPILSGNFKIACAKLKFPEDSFQSWRTILKTREMLQVKKKSGSFGTKCWGKLIPQRQSMLQKKRENIIFLPLEKVFKIKPGWKAHSRNPGKKVVKKPFYPT